MNFDLHIGLKMEKAACDFLHLTSTSSSVSPVVIRPPTYVKAVTRTRITQVQLMLPVFAGGPNSHLLGFGCIYLEPDPCSLCLWCLELLTHVGDLLAQQNHVVHNVQVL